jgi:hypothetical protein
MEVFGGIHRSHGDALVLFLNSPCKVQRLVRLIYLLVLRWRWIRRFVYHLHPNLL